MADKFEEYTRRLREDPGFRAKLQADPVAALAEWGLSVTPGVEFRVVENSPDVRYFVLPVDLNIPLPDSQMQAVAGGSYPMLISPAMLRLLGMLLPR